MRVITSMIAFAALVSAAPASAQSTPARPSGESPDVPLKLDREVFSYPADGRRDPFKPLGGKDAMGPLFEELVLRSIIYSPDARLSVVNIVDNSRTLYRLRAGDIIGNARVVAIEPYRVRLAVSSYGLVREEILELAQRETVSAVRRGQAEPEQSQRSLSEQLGEELLRAITGRRDSTAVQQQQQQQTQTDTTRNRAPIVPRVRGGGTER